MAKPAELPSPKMTMEQMKQTHEMLLTDMKEAGLKEPEQEVIYSHVWKRLSFPEIDQDLGLRAGSALALYRVGARAIAKLHRERVANRRSSEQASRLATTATGKPSKNRTDVTGAPVNQESKPAAPAVTGSAAGSAAVDAKPTTPVPDAKATPSVLVAKEPTPTPAATIRISEPQPPAGKMVEAATKPAESPQKENVGSPYSQTPIAPPTGPVTGPTTSRDAKTETAGPLALKPTAPPVAATAAPKATATPPPLPNLSSLIDQFLQNEETERTVDQKETDSYVAEADRWTRRTVSLREKLQVAIPVATDAIVQAGQTWQRLPADLQTQLGGRQEGLELIGKMAGRLLERLAGNGGQEPNAMPSVGKQGWSDLAAAQVQELAAGRTSQPAVAAVFRAKLRGIGQERYQVVTRARELAESRRKGFFNFIKKHLLPVLDGVDDGQRYAMPLIEKLSADHAESANYLAAWRGTYDCLRKVFVEALASVDVRRIEVAPGAPFDYNRHEPIDVEPDQNLPTESIKSVTETGYEFAPAGEAAVANVVRAAQVVVVKN
ncbi:MAG: nucleotide exchange factor GrpE [Tepidisphaeraceae bacterium]